MARERVSLDEQAAVTRSDDRPETCGDMGPFGVACTEPAGHAGGHQHHTDGARASWSKE